MNHDLVVVGAGGFGREVLDVVDAINALPGGPKWNLLGVVDDNPSDANIERLRKRHVQFLGDTDVPFRLGSTPTFTIAIGNPSVRRTLAIRYEAQGLDAAVLVHPHATLGFDVEFSAGTIVCAGVRLTTNIRIGRHVHINVNAIVGHDSFIGDYTSVNPLVAVSGDCHVGDGVLLGAGAVVLNGLKVGTGAVVGGSACVIRDVPAGTTVVGVPARQRAEL